MASFAEWVLQGGLSRVLWREREKEWRNKDLAARICKWKQPIWRDSDLWSISFLLVAFEELSKSFHFIPLLGSLGTETMVSQWFEIYWPTATCGSYGDRKGRNSYWQLLFPSLPTTCSTFYKFSWLQQSCHWEVTFVKEKRKEKKNLHIWHVLGI